MSRLFGATLLLTLLFQTPANAALTAGMQWEIQASCDNAVQGCGYVGGGTDYTQQATPQLSPTDLACAEAASTTLTSATGGFTAQMVGNLVYITGGGSNWTAGFYEIKAYTDTNTVTIDRDPTDGDGGDGSSGVGYVGGCCTTIDTVADVPPSAGDTMWIKAGTYTAQAVTPPSTFDGGSGTPLTIEGYNTSHGDNPTGTNRPKLDSNDAVANCIYFDGSYGVVVKNLVCEDSTGDGFVQANNTSGNIRWENVRSTSNDGDGWDTDRDNTWINCESDNNSGMGINQANTRNFNLLYSYIHDNSSVGVAGTSGELKTIIGCVADTNSGDGFYQTGEGTTEHYWLNNIAYNNYGANNDGFQVSASATSSVSGYTFINNVALDNGDFGFEFSGGSDVTVTFDYNSYNGNGDTALSNMDFVGDHDTSDDPLFNAKATGDFTVTTGSPLIDAGLTVNNTGVTGTYKANIGIDQDDTVTAGGGGGGGAAGHVLVF